MFVFVCFVLVCVFINGQQTDRLTSWNYGDPSAPYSHRNAISGYNNITDEFFMFGGYNNVDGTITPAVVHKYGYSTGIWETLNVNGIPTYNAAQGYTQYNNVIYYYTTNAINTVNMNAPYSTSLTISASSISTLINGGCCLSADINGHLFMSSGI